LSQIRAKPNKDLQEQNKVCLDDQVLLSFINLENSMNMGDRLRLIISASIVKIFFFDQRQNRRQKNPLTFRDFSSFSYKTFSLFSLPLGK